MTNIRLTLIQMNVFYGSFEEKHPRMDSLINTANLAYREWLTLSEMGKVSAEERLVTILTSLQEIFEICRNEYFRNEKYYKGILDSMLSAILEVLRAGKCSDYLQKAYLSLGNQALDRAYPSLRLSDVKYEVLRYTWLKKYNLNCDEIVLFDDFLESSNAHTTHEPSAEEVEEFYQENRQQIYRFLLSVNDRMPLSDPLRDHDKARFYHTHRYLSAFQARSNEATDLTPRSPSPRPLISE